MYLISFYYFINLILLFLLLKCAELSSSVFYCTDVNLLFLQPEANSFHFWCERAFTFAKNIFIYIKNKQASPDLKSNAKVAQLYFT